MAEDFPRIARGQLAAEAALARQANRLLLCDTDLMTTVLWSEFFTGSCEPWIREEAAKQRFDLTLLTDCDVPFVDDPQRFQPTLEARRTFFERMRGELESLKRPYVVLRGTWEQRWVRALTALDKLLKRTSNEVSPGAGNIAIG